MSLQAFDDGWYRFSAGTKWRCKGPKYLCEIGEAGNTPNLCRLPKAVAALRRVKAFYQSRLQFRQLDEHYCCLDILVTNTITCIFRKSVFQTTMKCLVASGRLSGFLGERFDRQINL